MSPQSIKYTYSQMVKGGDGDGSHLHNPVPYPSLPTPTPTKPTLLLDYNQKWSWG